MISYYDPPPPVNLDKVPDQPGGTPVQELTDESILHFGKAHNGKKLKNVPASYLHWFYTNVSVLSVSDTHKKALLQYIQKHLAALRKEHTDGIWQRPTHLGNG